MSNLRVRRLTRRVHVLAAVVLAGYGCTVLAQNAPGVDPADRGGMTGTYSRQDVDRLGSAKDGGAQSSHESAAARAKAKAQAAKYARAMQLDCAVDDARLVVAGSLTAGGQEVSTRVYEVACSGGPGYLLETQGTDKALAISCVAAESARADDVAKGREAGYFCSLPANKDVWASVAALMATAGTTCTVRNLRWVGRSTTTNTEYAEVACRDGKGFVLGTAIPGTTAKTAVLPCAEAARRGITCRLTETASAEPQATMQTYKEALARNGVRCEISQIRLIGQEDHLRRYVVEYLCAGQGSGRVAFLPLDGNTNPYEAMDCGAAVIDRGVACVLTAPN